MSRTKSPPQLPYLPDVARLRFALPLALGLLRPLALPAQSGVAIERRLAERMALRVGDTVTLTPDPTKPRTGYTIEAIYEPRPDPATALRGEYRVRFHLPDLARLLGEPDKVDRFGVAAAPGISADSLAFRINQLAFGFRAYPSATIASESSKTFVVVSRFHRAIGFISIMASTVFLLAIMLLKVEERRLDAAVLRMIGISRATVFKAFVLEACLLALVGSAVGTGLAMVATNITNWAYQRRFETSLIFAQLTPGIVAFGVGLSIALGIGAGALAAVRLIRTNPLALWRRTE